jgi:hypothetical protein
VSTTSHTPTAPADFFAETIERFECAARRVGLHERWYSIAGAPLRLRFAGESLVPLMTPAMAHLAIEPQKEAALTVSFFDTESTGTPMLRPRWGRDSYGAKGEITGYNTDRVRTTYQPGEDILRMIDRQRRQAVYWTPTFRLVRWWEVSFPLRTILHWWCIGQPLQTVHAGAVGTATGGGVLIAGRSGSGKSTATLACLFDGLLYAGDDYVLVRCAPVPWVYSLYSTAKVEPSNLELLPGLRPFLHNPGHLDTQKAMVFLHRSHPESLTSGLPLKAIFLPRVTGRRETSLRPAAPAQALLTLAPTTLNHLPGAGDEAFQKMSSLVKQVPCYHLEAGTDLPQIPRLVREYLDGPV